MTRHRKHNWHQLLSGFEKSGQTQAEFCKQHGINPSYFSLKLGKYKAASPPAFVRVDIEPQNQKPQEVIVEVGNCKIYYPVTMPAESLAALVRLLA